MATDKLYELAQDPQTFLLLYKLYLQSSKVVASKEEVKVNVENVVEKVPEKVEEPEEKIERTETEEKVNEKQIVESKHEETIVVYENDSALLKNLIKYLGKRKSLPKDEFCKLFERGENGLFFKEFKEKHTVKELIDFLHDCVIPHSSFSSIKKFPITISLAELFDLSDKQDKITKVTGCAFSSIVALKSLFFNSQFHYWFDNMKLTFDLKLSKKISTNFNSVIKIHISDPSIQISSLVTNFIDNWPSLKEIECEYYNIVLSDKHKIVEITFRDDVHASVVEEILIHHPSIIKLNANIKYWVKYYHRISNNKKLSLGVLIPSGQSKLFKILFRNHKISSYPFYPEEDPLVSLADFRKFWCEELGLVGLISNLQEDVQSLRSISEESFSEDEQIKVKCLAKKVDRLMDRIDEEYKHLVEMYEECLYGYEEIKNQSLQL